LELLVSRAISVVRLRERAAVRQRLDSASGSTLSSASRCLLSSIDHLVQHLDLPTDDLDLLRWVIHTCRCTYLPTPKRIDGSVNAALGGDAT